MRHLITSESCAVYSLHPGTATGAKLHAVRRKHGEKRIALIVKRRDAGTVGLREQNAAVRCVRVREAAQNIKIRLPAQRKSSRPGSRMNTNGAPFRTEPPIIILLKSLYNFCLEIVHRLRSFCLGEAVLMQPGRGLVWTMLQRSSKRICRLQQHRVGPGGSRRVTRNAVAGAVAP
jgi:hypothetical protein